MRLQYLFKDHDHETDINNYEYKHEVKPTNGKNKGSITRVISPLRSISQLNNKCWIVEFSLPKEDLEAAKHLSEVHKEIMEYKPMVLLNEASEYYTKKLFPLFNEFEMRLRKYLYLSIGLANNDSYWKSIKDLPNQDFFTIYTKIFTSKTFNKELKNLTNADTLSYTKEDIINKIKDIDEKDVLWDSISNDTLSIIKKSFQTIKRFRNDVMHAHYITYSTFSEASSLLKNVNGVLNTEINKIYQGTQSITISDEAMVSLLVTLGAQKDLTIKHASRFYNNLNAEDKQLFTEVFTSLLDNIDNHQSEEDSNDTEI